MGSLAIAQVAKPGRKGEAIPPRPEGGADALDQCAQAIHSRTRGVLRETLHIARLLLQARALHARPVGKRGQGRKSSDTVSLDSNEGFDAWLNAQKFEFDRRSAYRYLLVAERIGLTADSTEKDVDDLDLTGVTMKALMAPAAGGGLQIAPSAPTPDPVEVAESYWQPMLELTWTVGQSDSEHHKALLMMPLAKLQELAGQMDEAARLVKSTLEARLK